MKILVILLLSIVSTPINAQSLFNGKDLTGWHVDVPRADNNPTIEPSFIVRNGLLVSKGIPEGHLITDKIYENYICEYWVRKNSEIELWLMRQRYVPSAR